MANDMKLSLKKIRFDKDEEFFLYSRHKIGKSFHINLFDVKKSEAYSGDISEKSLRSMADTRRTAYEGFLANTICALMWDDLSESQFAYSFEKDDGEIFFRWSKVYESEDMKVNLGHIKLSCVEFRSVIETVLCQVSLELHSVSLSLDKTKLELEESNKEKERSKDFIKSAIKLKEDMEKELYSKFVLLLNKKKEKIRKLKERAYASSSESGSDSETGNTRGKKRTKKMPEKNQSKRAVVHVTNSSEDEASYSTDEDLFSKPGQSTSHPSACNSSLLLDDDDFEAECPVQQPRQRCTKGFRSAVFTQNDNKGEGTTSTQTEKEDESSTSDKRGDQTKVADNSIENLLDQL